MSATKHSSTCKRAWARLDPNCPRCRELAAGAPARKGWTRRADQHSDIATHDCKTSGCGPVCTYGDW